MSHKGAWGGIVSIAMYQTGDILQDFGNGGYSTSLAVQYELLLTR